MIATPQELSDFHRYAEEKLSLGIAATLQQLLDEWIAVREHQRSVAAIRESLRQYEDGEGLPVGEAFDEVRRKLSRDE